MIKTLSIVGIERNFHNLIKGTYEKCTANIINSERFNFFPTKIENKIRIFTLTSSTLH